MLNKFKKFMTGKKRNIILILICFVIAGMLIAYSIINNKENAKDTAVNRGQVAKAVSLLFHSKSEIDKCEDMYFNGSSEWYVGYMNMMYQDTYFTKNQVKPLEREILKSFTYADLDNLFVNMGVVDKKLLSYVNNNRKNAVITLKEWNKIYKDLRTLCDYSGNVKQVELVVVGTISNVPTFEPWVAATDMGMCGFDGLVLDYCIDKKIEVMMRDNEIITVLDVVDDDVTYANAWIESVNNGVISAFIEGAKREFYIEEKEVSYNNVTADIVLEKNKLKEYKIKNNFITGKVLALTDSEIEIEGHGKYSVSKDIKVYSLYGELVNKKISDIKIGYDIHRFVLSDNQITSAVIDRDVDAMNIRVLLMNSGYEGIYHDEFVVSCDSGFSVKHGTKLDMYSEDDSLTIKPDSEWFNDGRITIISNNSSDKLTVESILRNGASPSYRGNLELMVSDGNIIVINELTMEEYLYGVVPSEMPWSYDKEALKAQAICARTYAYKHMLNGGYGQYGAHVDDSTRYQVYNVSGEQENATKAVDATKGQILTYEGEPAVAYFFSTSCGSTTNSKIWGSDLAYIKGTLLTDGDKTLDLTDEETFNTFIRTGYKTFDSEYPWYRWKVTLTLDELTKTINSNIKSVSESGVNNVKVLDEDGNYVSGKVVGVGNVKKIEEGKRNTGGVLDYITIYGTENTVRVYREYNIRSLFNLTDKVIKRTNGDDVTTMSMLPSAYVLFDENTVDGLLDSYTIVGGGYGHGAGMSQNGANNMAKSGYTYDEILKFFFNDIVIESIDD